MRRRIAIALTLLLMFTATSTAPASASSDQAEATPVDPRTTPSPATDQESSSVPPNLQTASDFCLLQGGILVERFPFVGTNTSNPVQLDSSRWFCEFTGGQGADPPTSRISIGLSTLFAEDPTLAALAYLAKRPVPEVEDSSKLAVTYCADLGGSSQFGPDFETGGGWASDINDPAATSIGICVFPDGSAIDDWGLAYHAQGVIRGTDLTTLFQFDPEEAPENIFPND